MKSSVQLDHNGGVVTKLGGLGFVQRHPLGGYAFFNKHFDAKVMEEEERRERRRRQKAKVVNCCKKFTAFLFSHIGLAGMVVAYSILGGFIFVALEAPHEKKVKHDVIAFKNDLIEEILSEAVKLHCDSANQSAFLSSVAEIFVKFQEEVYVAVKEKGWDGKDDHHEADLQWSFAGALLFAVTVITTIGYGHIAPKTTWGRLVTIIYALIGIPLTFLYLSNIGNFLADCFRLFYKKICCDICCCQKCERDKKRERLRMKRLKLAQQRNMLLAQRYSMSRMGDKDDDSVCHSLDDSPPGEANTKGFPRSASAPRMCIDSCEVPMPPHRTLSNVETPSAMRSLSPNNQRPSQRTSRKNQSLSLEPPPPYNRPGSYSRPPSYRQSVTSTERLLQDTDMEASASDLEHAQVNGGDYVSSAENVRETAIIDSDTEDERTRASLMSPSFSEGFFDRLGESKETAIVDCDDNKELDQDANTLTLPKSKDSKNTPSRSGSNRSARSKSSTYDDTIESASLLGESKGVRRGSSNVSRASRKDQLLVKDSKEKSTKSKTKDKTKEKKDASDDRSLSRGKSKRDRSKSKSKKEKTEKHKEKTKSSKEQFGAMAPEKSDLRKSSSQRSDQVRSLSRKSTRKDKKSESNQTKASSKSHKSEASTSSQGHSGDHEAKPYHGSIESFVTAFSESSMCTQDESDDERPHNGDVIKTQPISHGPAVSFGGNDDITIELGNREVNFRNFNHVNQLQLSYMEDHLDFDDDDGGKVTVPISVCLIIIAGYIFAGSVLFTLWEDWDYLTGSYFCFITLSTIGFGDIVPGMQMDAWASHQKLVLCALWLAFGLSLLAMCFNLMQEEVKEKVKWIGHKIGLLKDDDPT